jgi:inosine/xanthosine triphosphate pyrophosphatase family protein
MQTVHPELTLVHPRVEQDSLTQQVVENLRNAFSVRVVLWPLPVHDETDTLNGLAARAARLSSLGLYEPVLVCFGGLFIESCRGFPGLRTQEVVRQIGPEGILRLLGNEPNRAARWVVILAFCRPGQPPRLFQHSVTGEIPLAMSSDAEFLDSVFSRTTTTAATLGAPNMIREAIRRTCEDFLEWRRGPSGDEGGTE